MIILAQTCYKTYNVELLAIIEACKNYCYYLESCKNKVLVLINHNNLCPFIDIKN